MAKASDFQFSNATVPPAYDQYYRPRIFDPFALVLLERAHLQPGMHVLDVATGPGTVAHIAALRVGETGAIVATDISEPMLAIARSKAAQPGGAAIEYVLSPAVPLAVGDGEFDVVLCQQGLQFFGDCQAALGEMRRALRPNGRIALAVWCSIERCPMFHAFWRALRDAGQPELAELYRAPFTLPRATLEDEIRRAGFVDIEIEEVARPLVFEQGAAQAIASLAASPAGPMIAALPQEQKEAFFACAERNVGELVVDGQMRTYMTSNVAVAVRPQ